MSQKPVMFPDVSTSRILNQQRFCSVLFLHSVIFKHVAQAKFDGLHCPSTQVPPGAHHTLVLHPGLADSESEVSSLRKCCLLENFYLPCTHLFLLGCFSVPRGCLTQCTGEFLPMSREVLECSSNLKRRKAFATFGKITFLHNT